MERKARMETMELLLSSAYEGGADALYRNLWSRAEAFTFLFSKPSPTVEAGISKTRAYAEMHREVPTEFFVYEKASSAPIGIAGVKALSPGIMTITDVAIGPDYWGKGYGKQIVSALTELAFREYGAEVVCYECFSENEASKRLAESCGYEFMETRVGELKKNGREVLLEVYQKRK